MGTVREGKRAKYYRLTPLGSKQLSAERSKWDTSRGRWDSS